MSSEDIKRALISDSLDFITSFALPIPIPTKLIGVLYEKMRKNPINRFLNIELDELIAYYHNEKDNLLKLTFNNKTEPLPQKLVLDNTEEQLNSKYFIFRFESSVFELEDQFRSKTSPAFNTMVKGVKYINNENLRLYKLEKENDTHIFHTQPVYYETYLHTNLLVDYKPKNREPIRTVVHPEGKLEPFEESLLANHIGVNVLVFTPEGDLIIPVRSKEVSYAPLELATSISGAVTANDVADGRPIQEHVIIREGLEELGLMRNEIVDESIKFLGLTRELLRGGKPEIFFAMQTKLSYQQIVERWKQAEDKWESSKLIYFPFGESIHKPLQEESDYKNFERKVVELFERYGSNMSLPFVTNLALWLKLKRAGN